MNIIWYNRTIKDILLRDRHQIAFYLPYELYVLFKGSNDIKNIKNIIKLEIGKSILGEHAISIKLEEVTPEAKNLFLVTVTVKEYSVYQKIKEVLLGYKELIPPWTAFPNMIAGRGNQGYVEHYYWSYWVPYWRGMSEEERNTYCTRHSAPEEWVYYLNTYGKKLLED